MQRNSRIRHVTLHVLNSTQRSRNPDLDWGWERGTWHWIFNHVRSCWNTSVFVTQPHLDHILPYNSTIPLRWDQIVHFVWGYSSPFHAARWPSWPAWGPQPCGSVQNWFMRSRIYIVKFKPNHLLTSWTRTIDGWYPLQYAGCSCRSSLDAYWALCNLLRHFYEGHWRWSPAWLAFASQWVVELDILNH